MAPRITNAVLSTKIDGLKEYLIERNNKQDIIIEQNRKASNKNTVAIAGIKGASGAIAFFVSVITTITGVYFGTKQ